MASPRPHALAALAGVRLDFNNSRDGSWWSPWIALRGGVVSQAGVQDGAACEERYVLAPYLRPRLGADLWLGKAAVTFALGYDELPARRRGVVAAWSYFAPVLEKKLRCRFFAAAQLLRAS